MDLAKTKQLLREKYGFEFPDDFFAFWEFAKELNPTNPLEALDEEAIGIYLAGPFEVLAGEFEGKNPRLSMYLHWRWSYDPPEFFTIMTGDTDGLHWGYWLDDPTEIPHYVASYFSNDAYEINLEGNNIFEAVRIYLERAYISWQEYLEYEGENESDAEYYKDKIERVNVVREILKKYATGERHEIGDEYIGQDEYSILNPPRQPVASTFDAMGIVVPSQLYRTVRWTDEELREIFDKTDNPQEVIEEAWQALREGFPGTALQIGKDLWEWDDYRDKDYGFRLMDAAYEALGRNLLRQVLQVHQQNRFLRSLDILSYE